MTEKLTDRIDYMEIVSNLQKKFYQELKERRKEDKYKGKYLIGISVEPYRDMKFKIYDNEEDSRKDKSKDLNKILIEHEI